MQAQNRDKLIFFFSGILLTMLVLGAAAALIFRKTISIDNRMQFGSSSQESAARNLKSFFTGQPKKQTRRREPEIFVASSLDKVFLDGNALMEPTFSDFVSLALAINEFESFQVIINNADLTLSAVTFECSNLIDRKNGNVIDRKNFVVRAVGYVPTQKPYYPVKYTGMWPDPLIPIETLDIQPGITQPFWVTFYAPYNTQQGSYVGEIRVKTAGRILKQIPIAVRIFGFTLPLHSNLKTAFDFYGHITKDRYPIRDNETEENYQRRLEQISETFIVDMLMHRMNPILNVDPFSETDLRKIDIYRRFGLNNFSIGKRGGTFNNNWPLTEEEIDSLLPHYRQYGEALKFNRLLQYHYIYVWDEGKIEDQRVAKVCSMLHAAHPELKTLVCFHGFWQPEKNPEWGKDIDIWCFQIDSFNESKMQTLKQQGVEIWMYVSGPSGSGTPNLAIDFDAIDYRIISWLCWKYDIKGFLYWCVNWWPYVDPFVSAANTKWQQNGNGLLFYPGKDGPVDSIRTEVFRDGMEDYEYMYLLAKKIQDVKDIEFVRKAKCLLNVDSTIASSMRDFTKDASVLLQRRQQIAQLIEELDNKNE